MRHSKETKNKMSISQKINKSSDEVKAKMRKPRSEAHKRKISISRKGQLNSEETKQKKSVEAKKHWSDPEIRNRMIIGMENRRNNEKK